MSVKKILKQILNSLPQPVASTVKNRWTAWGDRQALRRAYRYDQALYLQGSGLLRQYADQPSIEANIIKTYHRLEKGLALKAPRPGFGRDAVELLLDECEKHVSCFGVNASIRRASEALDAYIEFNANQGVDLTWMTARHRALQSHVIATARQSEAVQREAGTLDVTKAAVLGAVNFDAAAFFGRRYSVRQFAPGSIEPELFRQAALMAQKTPSVCNRESGTAYVVQDRDRMARILSYQNGNRGFGDQAGAVLIFTSRLSTFLSVGERYQAWIDGGLFAMTWVYALHALGLGSCCLNWSVEPEADMALKKEAGIPKDEVVIMLLAVGHLPEQLKVAASPRRPMDEVLKFL